MPATPGSEPRDFESLLRDALPRAYRFALHLTRNGADAEDLVQEACLLALKGFGTFEEGTNFTAWFLRIELNAFYTVGRRARRRPAAPPVEAIDDEVLEARRREWSDEDDDDPARALMSRLDERQILDAIAALPDEYRAVAALAFEQDLQYHEIAAILGCPIGTVRSRLHRARRLLKDRLWDLAFEHGIVHRAAA